MDVTFGPAPPPDLAAAAPAAAPPPEVPPLLEPVFGPALVSKPFKSSSREWGFFGGDPGDGGGAAARELAGFFGWDPGGGDGGSALDTFGSTAGERECILKMH